MSTIEQLGPATWNLTSDANANVSSKTKSLTELDVEYYLLRPTIIG